MSLPIVLGRGFGVGSLKSKGMVRGDEGGCGVESGCEDEGSCGE